MGETAGSGTTMLNIDLYGPYVWSCYALTITILGWQLYRVIRAQKNLKQKLKVQGILC